MLPDSKMALDDLHHVKDDMTAFIEGHGMRRFMGYVSDDVSSVMWENNGNTEGWKDFVELAKAAGASFLTMNDVVLDREDIDPLIARLLVGRGVRSAEEAQRFLIPAIDHLHSPYLMLGMKAAVERLQRAIANQEKILIYGDYDVDGTTAIVILKKAIEILGGSADFHVPHRIKEGYGMRDEVIERAAANGVRLVISVDTGIRAFAAAETARLLGLDLIVSDHHLPDAHGVP